MATLDPSMHSRSPVGASVRDRAMMAHDVRGALQGIVGGVAMLDRSGLAPAQWEQLDRIEEASRSLSRLVRGLVDAEAAAPGIPLEASANAPARIVDLSRFQRDLARRWKGEARERRVDLVVETAPDAPARLRADFVALERAVGNLVCNALRHGGDRVRIDLRGENGGGVFVVRDSGPGLAANPRDQDGFGDGGCARGDGQGLGQGQGLGLHIVGRLCGEMGATFSIAEPPGGGVEARIAFPAFLCAAAEEEPAPAVAVPDDLRGMRILLAEDNPTNQLVATQMLRALGAEVVLGVDGVDALQKFESAPFDLVVADIEMPRMSGLDVIRAIRARGDARASVPIVALTAYAMREHRDRIAAAGANGLISKPVTSVAALGRALREHAGPKRAAADSWGLETPAEPVADLQVFEALCAAIGMGMMAELLDKVIADLAQARADLEGAIEPLDRKAIRSASHILISVAGAVGATRLQACARELNIAAHSGEEAGLPCGVRRCVAEIDAAVEFARSRRPAG